MFPENLREDDKKETRILLKNIANHLRNMPMRQWPAAVFEQLGMMNPFETGNLKQWRKAIDSTRYLTGAVVECGTFRAESLAPLAWLMKETGDLRPVFGLDSFSGFPTPNTEDLIEGKYMGRDSEYFARTSEKEVAEFIRALGLDNEVILIPGFFDQSIPTAPVGPISVLILDCDLYESYKVCLHYLYPKVQPGGWILFDEYFSPRYPGARLAVDDFFADKPETPSLDTDLLREDPYERWFLIKEG